MNISALSQHVGLPPKTIRFYEQIGLISTPKRGDNGYRIYEKHAISELLQIKNARDLGLPIQEIRKLMRGCIDGDCEHTKAYVTGEIKNYQQYLRQRIKQLKQLEKTLSELHTKVQQDEAHHYCCNILGQLAKGGESPNGREN